MEEVGVGRHGYVDEGNMSIEKVDLCIEECLRLAHHWGVHDGSENGQKAVELR